MWSIHHFYRTTLESCFCCACKTKASNCKNLLCCTQQWRQHDRSRIYYYSFHSKIQLLSGTILYFSFPRQILTLFKDAAVLSTCCLLTSSHLHSTPEKLVVDETKVMRGLWEVRATRWFSFGWGFISIYTYSAK